jgi:hypothetical protein
VFVHRQQVDGGIMKTLGSVMALALALAVALTWPSAGEAQSKGSKAKRAQTSQQQKHVRAGVVTTRRVPCERHVWWGCVGWDPDPNVRVMLGRDVGGDD